MPFLTCHSLERPYFASWRKLQRHHQEISLIVQARVPFSSSIFNLIALEKVVDSSHWVEIVRVSRDLTHEFVSLSNLQYGHGHPHPIKAQASQRCFWPASDGFFAYKLEGESWTRNECGYLLILHVNHKAWICILCIWKAIGNASLEAVPSPISSIKARKMMHPRWWWWWFDLRSLVFVQLFPFVGYRYKSNWHT